MSMFTKLLIALLLACLYLLVSTMDSKDELVMATHYTKMVCEGTWPDYRNEEPDCNEYKQQTGVTP